MSIWAHRCIVLDQILSDDESRTNTVSHQSQQYSPKFDCHFGTIVQASSAQTHFHTFVIASLYIIIKMSLSSLTH